MKRILMLGLLALSLLCGTAFAKTGEGMTIWFDTGGSVGDGYGTIVQNGAKAAAADMGCELRLLYSDWNPETMITHFRNAVAARPDGIVVMGHPGDAAFGPLVDAAFKQGIVVTSIDTALPETQARHRAKGFGYVGTDNYTQGKALAEEVLRRTNLKKGDRAFVWGLKRIPDRGRRAQAIVEMLEQAGVTSFHVTLANHSALENTIPPASHPAFGQPGCFLKFCDAVRQYTRLPLCGVGGLNDPDFVEQQLASGRIQCAAMSRQLLADPEWVNKLQKGQAKTIHRCVRCNKKCLGGLMAHQGTRCIYDARREEK